MAKKPSRSAARPRSTPPKKKRSAAAAAPARTQRAPTSKGAPAKLRPSARKANAAVRRGKQTVKPRAGRASAAKTPSAPTPRRGTIVIREAAALQALTMNARARGLTVGFVPTMGALHSGHAALFDEARRRADLTVVSIFVNPKQFGAGEDLARYPRPFEADLGLAEACGVDVLFAPSPAEIYPPGFQAEVRGGPLTAELEGAARPGHFDGVLTVVTVLLNLVAPHFAVFGEKDYQQLTLLRRLVRDLRMPVEIVAMPVIRDVDGLALSSRNAYLGAQDRARAVALYRALMAAQDEAQRGVTEPLHIINAARAVLAATEGVAVDYVELRDPVSLAPLPRLDRDGRLLIAAKLAGVRLIDNGPLFHAVRHDAPRVP